MSKKRLMIIFFHNKNVINGQHSTLFNSLVPLFKHVWETSHPPVTYLEQFTIVLRLKMTRSLSLFGTFKRLHFVQGHVELLFHHVDLFSEAVRLLRLRPQFGT